MRNVSLLHRVLSWASGLSADIYQLCSESVRRQIHHVGAVLLFTSFVSALVLAYMTYSVLNQNVWVFLGVFIIWFAAIYFFDRMLVAGQQGRLQKVVRFIAVVGMTFLHAIIFDSFFFEKDLKWMYLSDQQTAVRHIESSRHIEIEHLELEISSLYQRNQDLTDSISSTATRLELEANGTGGSRQRNPGIIYMTNKVTFELKQVLWQKEIEGNLERIKQDKNSIDQIKGEQQQAIGQLPAWDDAGLLTRTRLLHRLIFEEGDMLVGLLSVVWMMLMGCMEALPLLAKSFYPLKEFQALQSREQELQTDWGRQQMQIKFAQNIQEMLLESRRKIAALNREQIRKRLEDELEEIRRMFQLELNLLEEFEKEGNESKARFGDAFQTMAEAAFTRAVARLKAAVAAVVREENHSTFDN